MYDAIFVDRSTYIITIGDDYMGHKRKVDNSSSKIRKSLTVIDRDKLTK